MASDPLWLRALLRCYPREYRDRHAADLPAALRACIARERRARVPAVLIYVRLFADAISTSVLSRSSRQARSGDPLMHSIAADLRYAFRLLRRAPLFSTVTIATLALAIGANTAIFSIVNGVLLRPLPYANPDRLVVLYEGFSEGKTPFGFSAADVGPFSERARSYEGLAPYVNAEYELSGISQPERITATKIGATLFDLLGVRPALGRPFTEAEDSGRQLVAILSDGLWRRAFGANPDVLGKPLLLDRRPYTIVGVMPPWFTFPNRGPHINNLPADVFVPISYTANERRGFGSRYNSTIMGRLKPGVTVAQAATEAKVLSRQIFPQVYPAYLQELSSTVTTTVAPLADEVVGDVRLVLYVLLAAVAVVLLIACADIACLTLTRAAARQREMAVRSALGAGRARVMRLIFLETGVLAGAGAACGLALAWWGQRALLAVAPAGIPRAQDIGFDARVLLFTSAIAVSATFVCGLLPAYESTRRDSASTLKQGGRTTTAAARQRRIFAALVTAQFAFAVVLVSAGGLLVRSLVRLTSVDPGIHAENVVSAATSLPVQTYSRGQDVRAFYGQLLERLRRIPGVSAVGAGTDLPLTVRERRAFTIENPSPAIAALPRVIANDWVTGDYFTAIGARVMRGRALTDADTITSEPVVVINETLAQRYWPGEDPVGRRLAWGNPQQHDQWMRVVGVIADIKQAGLASVTEPETWQPWAQMPDGALATPLTGIFRNLRVMVRASVPQSTLVPVLRAEVRALDPALPVTNVTTLDETIGASAGTQRFNAALLGGFAGIALLLAALGIGGVLAISVSRRTQEIGIRLALGAHPGDVIRMVVRQGMALVAIGIAIGLPCAIASARLLRSLLFETPPYDPLTFGSAVIILGLVALIACAAPAFRASRVSPVTALRMD